MVSGLTISVKRPVLGVGAYGVTTAPGTRFIMNSAATVAFGFPTSLGLQVQKRSSVWTQLSNASVCDAPEQELSIQIADVYGVHIDNVDVLKPR